MTPFQQKDSRWGSKVYTSIGDKSQTIGTSGCGLLALTNAIYALTGGKLFLDPRDMDDWSEQNGFRTPNDGTSWGFAKAYMNKFYPGQFNFETITDTNQAIEALKNGAVIYTTVHGNVKKLYTSGGHYLAIVGYTNDGYFYVMDSDFYPGKFTVGQRPQHVKTNTKTLETWCKPSDFKPEMTAIGYVVITKNQNEEEIEMTDLEREALDSIVPKYKYNDGNIPSWARTAVDKAIAKKVYTYTENGFDPALNDLQIRELKVFENLGLL